MGLESAHAATVIIIGAIIYPSCRLFTEVLSVFCSVFTAPYPEPLLARLLRQPSEIMCASDSLAVARISRAQHDASLGALRDVMTDSGLSQSVIKLRNSRCLNSAVIRARNVGSVISTMRLLARR